MIGDKLTESMEMEVKQSFSDKLYNSIASVLSSASLILLLISFILYFVNPVAGIKMWLYIFYPVVIMMVISMFFAVKEILRNRYFITLLSCALWLLSLGFFIAYIIVQCVDLGFVPVLPSILPNNVHELFGK